MIHFFFTYFVHDRKKIRITHNYKSIHNYLRLSKSIAKRDGQTSNKSKTREQDLRLGFELYKVRVD